MNTLINTIKFGDVEVKKFNNYFYEICPGDHVEMTADKVEEVLSFIDKDREGEKVLLLLNVPPFGSIDKSATKSKSMEFHNRMTKGYAVIVDNLSSRMMANFYISLKNFNFPLKLFKNREKGITWLQNQK